MSLVLFLIKLMHPNWKKLLNSNTSQICHWKNIFNESILILIKGLINEYIY